MVDEANITRLTPTLFTGGDLPIKAPDAVRHIALWQEAGITTVIDCRIEWEDSLLIDQHAPDIRYVHTGINDAGQRVPGKWFDSVVDAHRHTTEGGATLVHCHMGINRGPSGAYALLLADGLDPVEALELIRTRRPISAVSYAEDALRWWHIRNSVSTKVRKDERRRLAEWRDANPHSTVRLIREARNSG